MRAELNYKLAGQVDGYYLIEVDPITGRPHQIRVQLSTLGCPIVGDNKYGYPRGSLRKSISLHARRLQFIHPIKKEPVLIVAPVPKDGFWERFEGMMWAPSKSTPVGETLLITLLNPDVFFSVPINYSAWDWLPIFQLINKKSRSF